MGGKRGGVASEGGTLQFIHNSNYFIVKINFGPPPPRISKLRPRRWIGEGEGKEGRDYRQKEGKERWGGGHRKLPPPTSIHPSCPPHALHQLDFTGSSQRKEGGEAREG